MDCKLTCRVALLKVSVKFELNELLFSGVEGLIVQTEEADKSSGGTKDSIESNEGRLCPFAVNGDISINDILNKAQPSSDGKEKYLSSVE
jgi:hypothetical protein